MPKTRHKTVEEKARMAGRTMLLVALLVSAPDSRAARPPLALPWAPNRTIFPSFWFGQNAKALDTDEYLRDVVGRHALAIYGWSHASEAAPRYSGEELKLSQQCGALKAKGTGTRCAVYRQGWLAMSNYEAQAAALAQNATRTAGWWQTNDAGEPTPHDDGGVSMLFWDFTNASARTYYQEHVIRPITNDSNVDAVFFDDMPGACCNSEHTLPSHYTREQAEAMCDGTLENFRAVAQILLAGGKLPIYSMFQHPASPCLYSQAEIMSKLGDDVNFARFAQSLQSDGAAPGKYGGNCSLTIEMAAFEEVSDNLSYIQWEDLRGESAGAANASLAEAVFMITRGAGSDDYSFYGSSTGWGESAWKWMPDYDRLAKAGAPLGPPKREGDAPGHYSRVYEHATVDVRCAMAKGERSTGTISYKTTRALKSDDDSSASVPVAPSAGCAHQSPGGAGPERHQLTVDGLQREYILFVPNRTFTAASPAPLVLNFHGWTWDGERHMNNVGMNFVAEAEGFIAVLPDGMDDNPTSTASNGFSSWRSWNAAGSGSSPGPLGPTCTQGNPSYCYDSCRNRTRGCDSQGCDWTTCVNDTAFATALLDTIESHLCIDLNRVYATGFSNGGLFTYQVAMSLSDRVAAVAAVAGGVHPGFLKPPAHPLALMDIHGWRDTVVPCNATEGKSLPTSGDGWQFTNQSDIVAMWRQLDGCTGPAAHYPTKYDGQSELYCLREGSCSAGSAGVGPLDVVRCAWSGDHEIPGALDDDTPIGPDYWGTYLIWKFFQDHPRQHYRQGL